MGPFEIPSIPHLFCFRGASLVLLFLSIILLIDQFRIPLLSDSQVLAVRVSIDVGLEVGWIRALRYREPIKLLNAVRG